jgi:hypothetical protein
MCVLDNGRDEIIRQSRRLLAQAGFDGLLCFKLLMWV